MKAVLFDLDGVLIENEIQNRQMYQVVADSLGHSEFVPLMWNRCLGVDYNVEVAAVCSEYGEAFCSVFFQRLVELKKSLDYFYHMKDSFVRIIEPDVWFGISYNLFKLTKRHVRIGVVSSSRREHVHSVLDTYFKDTRFDVIITGDDVPVGKPSPLGYQTAMSMLPDCDTFYAVEDSPAGIVAAQNAGCIPIYKPDTGDISDSTLPYPRITVNHVVEQPSDILDIIEGEE